MDRKVIIQFKKSYRLKGEFVITTSLNIFENKWNTKGYLTIINGDDSSPFNEIYSDLGKFDHFEKLTDFDKKKGSITLEFVTHDGRFILESEHQYFGTTVQFHDSEKPMVLSAFNFQTALRPGGVITDMFLVVSVVNGYLSFSPYLLKINTQCSITPQYTNPLQCQTNESMENIKSRERLIDFCGNGGIELDDDQKKPFMDDARETLKRSLQVKYLNSIIEKTDIKIDSTTNEKGESNFDHVLEELIDINSIDGEKLDMALEKYACVVDAYSVVKEKEYQKVPDDRTILLKMKMQSMNPPIVNVEKEPQIDINVTLNRKNLDCSPNEKNYETLTKILNSMSDNENPVDITYKFKLQFSEQQINSFMILDSTKIKEEKKMKYFESVDMTLDDVLARIMPSNTLNMIFTVDGFMKVKNDLDNFITYPVLRVISIII